MAKIHEVLVLDDEVGTAEFLAGILRRQGHQVSVALNLTDAKKLISTHPFAVVVSDLRLGPDEGTELIPFSKQQTSPPALIFITGYGSMDTAVSALHDGAFDYISKPDNLLEIESDLVSVVSHAIRHFEITLGQSSALAQPKAAEERSMVGTSSAMVRVYRTIAKAALTRENVLIFGESGTGKELVARAIHENSACGNKPFIAVNCCALTETLLESELFGHVRGSFTGATQNKRGLFEEAHEGTLFLDEIGDVSPSIQVKLLRAIQEGEIKPVGATESRKVDVRLVAATHRDLTKAIHEGTFREDLFYRLKVVLIEMPPLRDRQKDIPDLVNYFLGRYVARTGKAITQVSDEAMELLLTYPWPGNIRELENAVSRAATMTSSNVLYPEDFPSEILHTEEKLPVEPHYFATKTVGESLEELEKRHIASTLEGVNHNKSKAAEILGIDRATLYRKAFKYGIFSKADARPTGTP